MSVFKKKLSVEEVKEKLFEYTILFQSLFKYKNLENLFYKFLKSEKNSEPWEFLREVNKLPKMSSKKAIAQKTSIMNTYIKDGSPKELNLPARLKKSLLKDAEAAKTTKDIIELFKRAKKSVLRETSIDNFPRFIRSDPFYKIVGKRYLGNKNVMVLTVANRLDFTPDDFRYPYHNSKDIALAKYLATDSLEWKLRYSKSNGKLYTSDRNYFPKIPYLASNKFVKLEAVLPFSFKEAVINLFPLNDGYFGNYGGLTNIKTHTYYSAKDIRKVFPETKQQHEQPTVLYTSFYDYGKGIAKNHLSCSAFFDEKTGYFHSVIKPYHEEKYLGSYPYDHKKLLKVDDYYDPVKNKTRKVKCSVGTPVTIVIIKPVNDTTTLFSSSFVYPAGSIDMAKYGSALAIRASDTAKKILSSKDVKKKVSELDEEKDFTVKILKEMDFENRYDAYRAKYLKTDEAEFDEDFSEEDTDTSVDVDDDDEFAQGQGFEDEEK